MSQSGAGSCTTCRANTYAGRTGTRCIECPPDTVALPGTASASGCRKLEGSSGISNLFLVGDEWSGTFRIDPSLDSDTQWAQGPFLGEDASPEPPSSGMIVLAVTRVEESKISMLATITHGRYCALPCKVSPTITLFLAVLVSVTPSFPSFLLSFTLVQCSVVHA